MQALAIGVLTLLVGAGCAQQVKEGEEKPELSAEQKSLILDQAPSDLPNPTLIDFNGKVQLIGYSLEPARLAAPGSKLSLKLFWRSTSKLSEGYKLFTELVTPGNKRFEAEGGSALRALPPSSWEPGKVYVDDVTLTVPEEMEASRFSIVVGLKTDPIAPEEPEKSAEDAKKAPREDKATIGTFGAVYLRVLSGPADAKHGGVVATLDTGVTPGAKRARAAKDEKRGLAVKRPLPGKLPTSARPRPVPPAPAQ